MTCTCPKCNADINLDLHEIPEEGAKATCPECSGRFWVTEETFARRALKKEGKLYCTRCGHQLNHLVVCSACGVFFPDYRGVQLSKPVARQQQKSDWAISFSSNKVMQQYGSSRESRPFLSSTSSSRSSSRMGTIGIALVAVIALAAGGFYTYSKKKEEKRYVALYVFALYGIKSEADLSLQVSSRLAADWKVKTDAGQSFITHVNARDEGKLVKVKTELDTVMQKLGPPPQKFAPSHDKLNKLYGTCSRLQTLVLEPGNSLTGFTDSVSKSEAEYRSAVKDLKASLPEPLTEELHVAEAKFKDLREL